MCQLASTRDQHVEDRCLILLFLFLDSVDHLVHSVTTDGIPACSRNDMRCTNRLRHLTLEEAAFLKTRQDFSVDTTKVRCVTFH